MSSIHVEVGLESDKATYVPLNIQENAKATPLSFPLIIQIFSLLEIIFQNLHSALHVIFKVIFPSTVYLVWH